VVHIHPEKKALLLGMYTFPILILLSSTVLIGTPYMFVRIINLIGVIAMSACWGAFIREWFIQRKQSKSKEVR